MTALDYACNVFVFIGGLISICLFLSPLPTIARITTKKSVDEFKSDSYIATTMNCTFWVLYSLSRTHPHMLLVLLINVFGMAIEIDYLIIIFKFSNFKQRWWIVGWLAAGVVFTVGITAAAGQGFQAHTSRSNFVVVLCVFFGILLYASPLTITKKVVETKSVEYMPLCLSLTSFANAVIWTTYSCLQFDAFMFAGNIVGIPLGAAQLGLYWYYYDKETPETQQKPHKHAEVQIASV